MPAWIREHRRLVLAGIAGAVALRLLFIIVVPRIADDSVVYANIAKNWADTGIYGLMDDGVVKPTLVRLPGYPAFLALVYALFGRDNTLAVMLVQLVLDLGTCFLTAAIATEMIGAEFALPSFLLACFCPFIANYTAVPLTEVPVVFLAALAFWSALRWQRRLAVGQRATGAALISGTAAGLGMLMRPDGVVLAVALAVYVVFQFRDSKTRKMALLTSMAGLCCALLPLAPWTVRNWRVFGEFQPLAPRYANAPGEFVPAGFNRWVKTWMADYASVERIYWKADSNPPDDKLDAALLPARAFDSEDQRARTTQIFDEYNQAGTLSPELDQRFAALAEERIRNAPLRYYAWLPFLRVLDMWMRPRTEMLGVDPEWWQFDPPWEGILAIALGLLNLALVAGSKAAFWVFRPSRGWMLLALFVLLRCALLATLENPEPRYTLECYPMVIALAACTLKRLAD